MKASIYRPKSPLLSNYIDYFLFLKNASGNGHYKTFPNTNLCLALYKKNTVVRNTEDNTCLLTEHSANNIRSMLLGLHKKTFSVFYEGAVVQTCVLFKPGGLRFFTQSPIHGIDFTDDPFTQVFEENLQDFGERIFSIENEEEQVALWEKLLLQKLTNISNIQLRAVNWTIQQMQQDDQDEQTIVARLSAKLGIHPSTLYRNFLAVAGQSPKEFHKTVRFRRSLHQLMTGRPSSTHVAYNNHFFDQSHFIKDIYQFTGESPKMLRQRITATQGTLFWVKE